MSAELKEALRISPVSGDAVLPHHSVPPAISWAGTTGTFGGARPIHHVGPDRGGSSGL